MPLIDLVNYTRNDEAILSLWLVSVSTGDCGYTFTTKNGMVSLDCNMARVSSASSSHITIHGTAAKIQPPIHKILLLSVLTLKCCSQIDFNGTRNNGKRKYPWAESNDLKGLLLTNQFPRTLKDLKGPREPCINKTNHHESFPPHK